MEYSICIRTLGTAGEKYIRLLDSIKNLNIQPKEVIVVIPKQYDLPVHRIGTEKFIRSEKGMLVQRIIGYEEATSKYVLLLDDDVEFESDLIEKLSKPILENKCKITFPIYKELLPVEGIRSLIGAATLSAVPRINDNNEFIKILPSGGYSYNKNIIDKEYMYSQSAPGMCVFAETDILKRINLRDEVWVEKPGYALRDDAILIYKAFLNKYKSIGITGININHLDAGSSENNRNIKAAYANVFNHILFWKRFIYSNSKNRLNKFISILAIIWWAVSTIGYLVVKLIVSRDIELFKVSTKGIREGFKYIRSKDAFKESKMKGEIYG